MLDVADDTLLEEIEDWLDEPCTEEAAEKPGEVIFGEDGDERLGLRNTVAVLDVFRLCAAELSHNQFGDSDLSS